MQFRSPTLGEMSQEEVFNFLLEKVKESPDEYQVIVGTDSQNTYKTKMVTVICILHLGHGGQFFYHVEWLKKIKGLSAKIYKETEISLELAKQLNEFFHEHEVRHQLEIHADIGPKGKTKDLINGIVGWIESEDFVAKIKYNSFVASGVADKISK